MALLTKQPPPPLAQPVHGHSNIYRQFEFNFPLLIAIVCIGAALRTLRALIGDGGKKSGAPSAKISPKSTPKPLRPNYRLQTCSEHSKSGITQNIFKSQTSN